MERRCFTGVGRHDDFGSPAFTMRGGGGRGRCGGSGAALGGDGEASDPVGDDVKEWPRMELGACLIVVTTWGGRRGRGDSLQS
jgi:hypothetical protein